MSDLTVPAVTREVVARLDRYLVVAERHPATETAGEHVVFVLCHQDRSPVMEPIPIAELSAVLGQFWTLGLLAGRQDGIKECQSLLAGVPVDQVRGLHAKMMAQAADLIDGVAEAASVIESLNDGIAKLSARPEVAHPGGVLVTNREALSAFVDAARFAVDLKEKAAAYRRAFVDGGK